MEITVQDFQKTYNGQGGIRNIDLLFPDGQLTAIVGPSGCGKTTLLRCLAGFLFPERGKVFFGKQDVSKLSPQNRKAGMVFQQYALWPHLTVFQNVEYGLKLAKVARAERQQRVDEVLRQVELDPAEARERKPQQFSGGQQQRIALARALVTRPRVLLMDEPLSNLDAKVRQKLRHEIRSIQRAFKITAVYVTHDQEEALSMADHVVLMNNGEVVQHAPPEELYDRPNSVFSAQFLGDSSLIEVRSGENKGDKFVLRAEDIDILSAETAKQDALNFDAAGNLRMPVNLIDIAFTGSAYRYVAEYDGQEFGITQPEANPLGQYQARIPAAKVHRFHE